MLSANRTRLAGGRSAKCPICGKKSDKDHAPFCSNRCQQVDLNRWLGEQYRIPTEESGSNGDLDPES